MEKQIRLNNREVSYTLKTSARAKRARLSVYCDGSFVATRPVGFSENAIEKFIRQKANWVLGKIEYFKKFKGHSVKNNRPYYLKYKSAALKFVLARIDYFNKNGYFKFNKISIRNQATRWGSCSRKGNLNFNYKIYLLPTHIADYVIVHELCHLKELNHSHRFWNLVAKFMPNYLDIKKELRQISLS